MQVAVERQTLTVREAAAMLGVSRSFLYDLVSKGEVQAIKLGSRTLIARRVVDAIVNGEEPSRERNIRIVKSL